MFDVKWINFECTLYIFIQTGKCYMQQSIQLEDEKRLKRKIYKKKVILPTDAISSHSTHKCVFSTGHEIQNE